MEELEQFWNLNRNYGLIFILLCLLLRFLNWVKCKFSDKREFRKIFGVHWPKSDTERSGVILMAEQMMEMFKWEARQNVSDVKNKVKEAKRLLNKLKGVEIDDNENDEKYNDDDCEDGGNLGDESDVSNNKGNTKQE